jgi:ParB-like chromosome segregation protein Spo0J
MTKKQLSKAEVLAQAIGAFAPTKAEEDEQLRQQLLDVLGVPPGGLPYTTQKLSLSHLEVSDANMPGVAADVSKLVESFTTIGMLHPPAVERVQDTPHGEPRYHVLAGRRRTIAAHRMAELYPGWQEIECRVYSPPNEYVRGLIITAENMHRRDDWRVDVKHLYALKVRGEIITPPMLAASGFKAQEIGPLMQLVNLPGPIVEQITSGQLAQGDAKRIARLVPSAQEELATRASQGEKLTKSLIKETLRKQITPVLSLPLAGSGDSDEVDDFDTDLAPASLSATGELEGERQPLSLYSQEELVADLGTLSGIIARMPAHLTATVEQRQLATLLGYVGDLLPRALRQVEVPPAEVAHMGGAA